MVEYFRPPPTDTFTALNAALTIVTMALCNHANSPIPAATSEAGGVSNQSLRDALTDALACLPLIDKENRMVDKCAKFVATLQQCLNLLGMPRQEPSLSPSAETRGLSCFRFVLL